MATTYFDERVRGNLRAELILDNNEQPDFIEGSSLRHYKVRLSLETGNPKVERVIYKLDPTYYDPVRESANAAEHFGVEFTTYGDYPVTVDVQVGGEMIRKVVLLSELLEKRYRADDVIDDTMMMPVSSFSPDHPSLVATGNAGIIQQALTDIKSH